MDSVSLSQEFANSVLPVTIFIGILAVFGIIGNASVIYVYKWKYSACNFRTFVLCLAMIDFTSCVFVFPTEMYGHRIWFSYPKTAAWFCKLKTSMYAVAVFISSYILLLISIDRFRKVCRPLGWQISKKVAFRLCLFIFGLSMILIIPCPILFGIQTTNITHAGQNILITSCQRDDQYKDSIWTTIYVAVLYYASVVSFMVTTMVLYGMILRKLFCGGFLKEIDHTDELKRKSRLQEAEFSGDETKYGVFSSDTFLDGSSTCADEHRITNEPKLIRLKSADCLYIQYKDKGGCTKTERVAIASDLYNERGETGFRTRNSSEEQTDETVINSGAVKRDNQELDYNGPDKNILETLHAHKDNPEIESGTENTATTNDLWKQKGDMKGKPCESDGSRLTEEAESKVSAFPKNNTLETNNHLVAGYINQAYAYDGVIKTDEHQVTSYGDDATTGSKIQSSNAPKADKCDTEQRLKTVLKPCSVNATVSDTGQHINLVQTDATRISTGSVQSHTLHTLEENAVIIKGDGYTQPIMNDPYTKRLTVKTSPDYVVTGVHANGNELDIQTLETDKNGVSENEPETVILYEQSKDDTQDQESIEMINTDLMSEDTDTAEVHDSLEPNNIQTEEKPSQCETMPKTGKRSHHKLKHTSSKQRIRNKSLIMFVVTLIFNITTLIYFCIFTVVIRREHIFEVVTTKTAGIVFFLWRLYFFNHVINPVVYGALDPRFRQVVKNTWRRLRRKQTKLFIRK